MVPEKFEPAFSDEIEGALFFAEEFSAGLTEEFCLEIESADGEGFFELKIKTNAPATSNKTTATPKFFFI